MSHLKFITPEGARGKGNPQMKHEPTPYTNRVRTMVEYRGNVELLSKVLRLLEGGARTMDDLASQLTASRKEILKAVGYLLREGLWEEKRKA